MARVRTIIHGNARSALAKHSQLSHSGQRVLVQSFQGQIEVVTRRAGEEDLAIVRLMPHTTDYEARAKHDPIVLYDGPLSGWSAKREETPTETL